MPKKYDDEHIIALAREHVRFATSANELAANCPDGQGRCIIRAAMDRPPSGRHQLSLGVMSKGEQMLQTAVEAARRAGRVLAERYPATRTLTVKGYRDIVTDADIAAEAVILDLIRARFPGHTIISEEAGESEIGGGYAWIVDPLDGTTNYTHRVPVFAVSIGVLERSEPLIGVVHDQLRDQTFVAERGEGARLNGAPMHASRVAHLHDALVGLDWGNSDEVRERLLAYLHRILPRCGTVRALGSATLALAYVAAGWLDAYLNLALKPWDAAAGMLIVAEAGGRCSTLEGEPYRVDLPGCLATNGLIHEELLAALHGSDVPDHVLFTEEKYAKEV